MLKLKGLPLGDYQTNAYCVWSQGSAECWLFDAPFDSGEMVDLVKSEGLTPTRLLLTHAHLDHIAGVREIRAAWPEVRIGIHALEKEWLLDPELNLSVFAGVPVTAPAADDLFSDGDVLTMPAAGTNGIGWRVLHVPGHSPGSVAFYSAATGVCIGGDALFAGSIGRSDFPGCSQRVLVQSIREKLLTLPGETKVYPGHGPATTIAREAAGNPYLR